MHRGTVGIIFFCFSVSAIAQSIGDPGWVLDSSRFDARYPDMLEFTRAGVRGGIPLKASLPIRVTLSPGENIQNAINEVFSQGGGVILLAEGTYPVTQSITMKSSVVLRGVNRDAVILQSTLRSTVRTSTITMDSCTHAGLEDLTILYYVDGVEPPDGSYSNNPGGLNDLNVRHIQISGSDNWVDNCRMLNSGTDPVLLRGSYLTMRNNFTNRAYNKGDGGNGYYNVQGDHCLIVGDTVKNIRHYAVQKGANYCVTYRCWLEVDINFHNGDNGHNLIEQNTIRIPVTHVWKCFSAGVAGQHVPPGPENIIFLNLTDYHNDGPQPGMQDESVIYTYTGCYPPVNTGLPIPYAGTFYPVVYKDSEANVARSSHRPMVNPGRSILRRIDLRSGTTCIVDMPAGSQSGAYKSFTLNGSALNNQSLHNGAVSKKCYAKKLSKHVR